MHRVFDACLTGVNPGEHYHFYTHRISIRSNKLHYTNECQHITVANMTINNKLMIGHHHPNDAMSTYLFDNAL